MKLRHAARQATLTFAVVVLPLVLGCGSDNGTGTNGNGTDDNPLIGTWAGTSFTADGVESLIGTSLSFTVTINPNLTFSSSAAGDFDQVFCEVEASCVEGGTYQFTSTTVTFCDPLCDEVVQYTISDGTLTFELVDNGITIVITLANGPVTVFNPLLGTWGATSFKVDGVEVLAGTSLTFTVTLNDDLTFSESVSGDTGQVLCEGPTSCSDSGTYLYNTTDFSLCDPGCDERLQYTISGNTLTVTFMDGTTPVVIIFMRT